MTVRKNNDDDTIFPIIDAAEELENVVKEILYIEINVPFDKKVRKVRENRATDHIIKDVPAKNECCYIEHEEDSQTFKILKDKDRVIELIINTEKKLIRSKMKFEKAKLRSIKRLLKKAIKLLTDLWEEHIEL